MLGDTQILVTEPAKATVLHTYTDKPDTGIHINSYSYLELFAEKVRAFGERGRPRDLYDVINLYRNHQLPPVNEVNDILADKCHYKGINIPTIHNIEAYKDEMLKNWDFMLEHQLPALPSLETYWKALPGFFNWLEGKENTKRPALATIAQEGEIYQPPYGRLGLNTTNGHSMEMIRFAAGNHLCVAIQYINNDGHTHNSIIEPYSLKRDKNGNVILHTIDTNNNQIAAFNVNQIHSLSITHQTFTPKYKIELSPPSSVPSAHTIKHHEGIPEQNTVTPTTHNTKANAFLDNSRSTTELLEEHPDLLNEVAVLKLTEKYSEKLPPEVRDKLMDKIKDKVAKNIDADKKPKEIKVRSTNRDRDIEGER